MNREIVRKKLGRVVKVFAILEDEYDDEPVFSMIKHIAYEMRRKPDAVNEDFVNFLDLKARMEVLSYLLDILKETGYDDGEEFSSLSKILSELENRYDEMKDRYENELALLFFSE